MAELRFGPQACHEGRQNWARWDNNSVDPSPDGQNVFDKNDHHQTHARGHPNPSGPPNGGPPGKAYTRSSRSLLLCGPMNETREGNASGLTKAALAGP